MFNSTCDRLREYLKDKGSSPGLGLTLTLTTHRTANAPKTTIGPKFGLTHQTFGNYDAPEVPKQMTIFYGGRVFVLENVSSHKANEIMCLATSVSSSSLPSTVCHTDRQEQVRMLSDAFVHDLSQTRTRSLTRFFEKRKDRIKARAPYTLSDNSNKPVAPGHRSWLQLAAGNQ